MPNNDNMNSGIQEPVEQLNSVPQPVPEPSKYVEFKLKRSAEEIGFMPPRKEKKKEMSKGEKTFFLVIIAVLILVIAGGLYFILRKIHINPDNNWDCDITKHCLSLPCSSKKKSLASINRSISKHHKYSHYYHKHRQHIIFSSKKESSYFHINHICKRYQKCR